MPKSIDDIDVVTSLPVGKNSDIPLAAVGYILATRAKNAATEFNRIVVKANKGRKISPIESEMAVEALQRYQLAKQVFTSLSCMKGLADLIPLEVLTPVGVENFNVTVDRRLRK